MPMHKGSKPVKDHGPDYSRPLVRRLIGNPGGRRPTPVFIVLQEKYGKKK
jgi:hypothetical protein